MKRRILRFVEIILTVVVTVVILAILASCIAETDDTETAICSALYPFSIIGLNEHSIFGYMDGRGNVVIEAQFSRARPFIEGLAAVGMLNEEGVFLSGYIDKEGAIIIPPLYFSSGDFQDGIARVSILNGEEDQWFFINRSGEHINETGFNLARNFSEEYAAVMIYGYFDHWIHDWTQDM